MNCPGDEFLAGPRFTLDENGVLPFAALSIWRKTSSIAALQPRISPSPKLLAVLFRRAQQGSCQCLNRLR